VAHSGDPTSADSPCGCASRGLTTPRPGAGIESACSAGSGNLHESPARGNQHSRQGQPCGPARGVQPRGSDSSPAPGWPGGPEWEPVAARCGGQAASSAATSLGRLSHEREPASSESSAIAASSAPASPPTV
jgi:hypothetical protein